MREELERPQEPEGGNLDSRPANPDPFALPMVQEIEITRVRYSVPRPYYVGQERIECSNGVEFLVRTDGPIPIRALSPILFVGDAAVEAYDEVGENLYRFIAYLVEDLSIGAQISFGWAKGPGVLDTKFRYEPGSTEEER